MVPPRPKTHSRLRNGRNHAVCVHPFRGGTKWGITVAPSVGNYRGPATGEFTLVLMACIGDIPWPSTLKLQLRTSLFIGFCGSSQRVAFTLCHISESVAWADSHAHLHLRGPRPFAMLASGTALTDSFKKYGVSVGLQPATTSSRLLRGWRRQTTLFCRKCCLVVLC